MTKAAIRWVSLAQLHAETGFETRSLQYIRKREPGVLITRERKNKIEYKQPDCAIALRLREAKKLSPEDKNSKIVNLKQRRSEAETRMAEIELAEAEGLLIPLTDYESRLAAICERIRAVLNVIPSKYLGKIQVARTQIEAQAVGEAIKTETLIALQGVAEDLDDEFGADEEEIA